MQLPVAGLGGGGGGGEGRDATIGPDGGAEPVESTRQRFNAEDARARKELQGQERKLAVMGADVNDGGEVVSERDVAVLDGRGYALAHGAAPRRPSEYDDELPQLSEASLAGDRNVGGASRRRGVR